MCGKVSQVRRTCALNPLAVTLMVMVAADISCYVALSIFSVFQEGSGLHLLSFSELHLPDPSDHTNSHQIKRQGDIVKPP
jgi:hypothetical protein